MTDLFRKLLVELKRGYRVDPRRTLMFLVLALAGATSISFLVDFIAPFSGLWVILRSAILVPNALAIFSLAYFISIYLHSARVRSDENWLAYRVRYSQRTRIQFSVVAGAFILVWIYVIPKEPGYTFYSSILGAGILAIFAFVRPTSTEFKRRESGIPDPRDIAYDYGRREYLRKAALEREEKRKEDKKKKRETPKKDK